MVAVDNACVCAVLLLSCLEYLYPIVVARLPSLEVETHIIVCVLWVSNAFCVLSIITDLWYALFWFVLLQGPFCPSGRTFLYLGWANFGETRTFSYMHDRVISQSHQFYSFSMTNDVRSVVISVHPSRLEESLQQVISVYEAKENDFSTERQSSLMK